ncbi:MAG: extracellular solute-binding protein [Treponema sp.]|jgi:raffinose/stachyose/melibiose transport system substrate-binding protein|nr:extracellular solute-binding protein [Treponema sp.]
MKTVIRVVALALLACFAAACSGGNKEGEASASKVIQFWEIQTENVMNGIIDDSISRFREANPGFTVEKNILQNEDFKSKIVVALGSNTAPDIFLTWTGGGMIEYINANRITPLTKYMNQDNYKNYFMDAGIAQATFNGDIWAVPVENCSVAGVFYNKSIFNRLGIQVPVTITELEAACDKFLANNVIPFGLANKAKYVASFYYMYLVDRYAGAQLFADAANRSGVTFEDEAFLWAGKKIQEWARKGYFGEGYNSLDGETGAHRQMFYNNECAMVLDGAWAVSAFYDEEGPVDDMSLFPFPAVEGGKGDINSMVGTVGDNFYCVSSASPYPDESFDLIRHLVDETAIEKRIAAGRVPPTKNARAENALNTVVLDLLQKAPTIQLWYDQYLPSAMGEIHKDQLQALVGLSITPEEYNTAMERAAQSYLTN